MKKLIATTFGITAPVILILLMAPWFVNFNKYRPVIEQKISSTIDRQIFIDGNVSVSLLPYPSINIKDVRMINTAGTEALDMLKVEQVYVSIDLLPLLREKIKIGTISLINPEIEVVKFKDGTTNWDFLFAAKKPGAAKATTIIFSNFEIKDGKLTYRDGNTVTKFIGINIRAQAQSFNGPFNIVGKLSYENNSLNFSLDTSKLNEIEDRIQTTIQQALNQFNIGLGTTKNL